MVGWARRVGRGDRGGSVWPRLQTRACGGGSTRELKARPVAPPLTLVRRPTRQRLTDPTPSDAFPAVTGGPRFGWGLKERHCAGRAATYLDCVESRVRLDPVSNTVTRPAEAASISISTPHHWNPRLCCLGRPRQLLRTVFGCTRWGLTTGSTWTRPLAAWMTVGAAWVTAAATEATASRRRSTRRPSRFATPTDHAPRGGCCRPRLNSPLPPPRHRRLTRS